MSYICLMANRFGAVVAGDAYLTRLHDPHTLHSHTFGDLTTDKCHALKRRGIIFASCGLNLFRGKPIVPIITACLDADGTVDEHLNQLTTKLAAFTATPTENHAANPIGILLAQRRSGRTTVWRYRLQNGIPSIQRHELTGSGIIVLADGMHTNAIPYPRTEELRELPFEELRAAARRQVQRAIDYDDKLDQEDLNYLRSVGGEITSRGLKIKVAAP